MLVKGDHCCQSNMDTAPGAVLWYLEQELKFHMAALLLILQRGLLYLTNDDSSNGNISALLALCAGNSPVTGEFHAQRPVTRIFGVFFYLPWNKSLSKQSRRRWFETPSLSLWSHRNYFIPCGSTPGWHFFQGRIGDGKGQWCSLPSAFTKHIEVSQIECDSVVIYFALFS